MSVAVRFEGVSKRYRGGGSPYATVRHDIADAFRRVSHRNGHRPQEPPGRLALDGISFQLDAGQSCAIIGPNGAGKTTALKIICRITYPSAGQVRVRGRVGALIEIGSGIHPELTARENIKLYGQILGLGKDGVRRRFDDIIEFAELGDAVDVPVKMYSSGMQLRLGFAIASHIDPEVFVVDEALAVGDAGFQVKCVERMTELVREGRTLLFVSHNLHAVEALCERAIFLRGGRIAAEGPAKQVLAAYLAWEEQGRLAGQIEPAQGPLRLEGVTCHGLDGEERYEFSGGEGLEIRMQFRGDHPLDRPHVNLGITDGRNGLLVHCSMLTDGLAPNSVGSSWECRCRIERLPLRPRMYQVFGDVYGPHGEGRYFSWKQLLSFRIIGPSGDGPMALVNTAAVGALDVPYSWQLI
jgi:ABC-type polysaccharide/polyol phosphate transport system ATPase subunit